MRVAARFVCLAAALAFCASAAATEPAGEVVRPVAQAETVIAVYAVNAGISRIGTPFNTLIFAAWGDGHVVWSEDAIDGGPPYRSATVKPKAVSALLARLDNEGVLDDRDLARNYAGPDAPWTTILIRSGKKQLEMQSWHDRFEKNGKVAGTQGGIEALEGRRRTDVLKKQPAEFLYYRLVWDELRLAVERLKPSESKAVIGEILLKDGITLWREASAPSVNGDNQRR